MHDTEIRIHVSVFLLLAVFLVADLNQNPEFDPIGGVVLLVLGIAYAFVIVGNLLIYSRTR